MSISLTIDHSRQESGKGKRLEQLERWDIGETNQSKLKRGLHFLLKIANKSLGFKKALTNLYNIAENGLTQNFWYAICKQEFFTIVKQE